MSDNHEELRRLLEAATPGPWVYTPNPSRVVTTQDDGTSVTGCYNHGDEQDDRNAAFIAASRTAVPSLLDENDRLSAEVAALRAERDRLTDVLRGAREEVEMAWAERDGLRQRVEALCASFDPTSGSGRTRAFIGDIRAALAADSPEPERPTPPLACNVCGSTTADHDGEAHDRVRFGPSVAPGGE